jgi:transcriptional regulator with XRE-family HTH domain
MSGPEFRELLSRATLNQSQLAAILGVAPNTVSRWVNGKLPIPRYAIAYLELKSAVMKLAHDKASA